MEYSSCLAGLAGGGGATPLGDRISGLWAILCLFLISLVAIQLKCVPVLRPPRAESALEGRRRLERRYLHDPRLQGLLLLLTLMMTLKALLALTRHRRHGGDLGVNSIECQQSVQRNIQQSF